MEWLTVVYLVYTFIALYILTLFVLIYLQNKDRMYEIPPIKKQYKLSIVIPCFNAEKVIGETIETLLKSNYPGLKQIIVSDDCSTDNSYKIAKMYEKRYPGKVKAVRTPKNTGRAAGAKNYGARFVRTELIGFTDDDSRPRNDAISNMIGFFNDSQVGGVTSRVLVQNRNNFLEKSQAIEYKIISFTRKLLGFVDSVYVTNGPLSIYRKKAFEECCGFSMTNWTEDIELTWHLVAKGYKIRMALSAKVYTIAPTTFKQWFRQRLRWNVGGLQTINAYKSAFFRCGMLGLFIIPFFVVSWALAIFGLLLITYRIVRMVLIKYLTASYSIEAQTAILSMSDLDLTPSILIFFGTALFILGFTYNLLALAYSKEQDFKKHNLFQILGYMILYLTAYPAILIISVFNYIKGKKTWN